VIPPVGLEPALRGSASRLQIDECSAAMLPKQDLNETVSDEFVKRPQLFVGLEHLIGIVSVMRAAASLKRFCGFADDGIGNRFAGNLPQRDEAIDCGCSPGRRRNCLSYAPACNPD
jgi:hypothetical protein